MKEVNLGYHFFLFFRGFLMKYDDNIQMHHVHGARSVSIGDLERKRRFQEIKVKLVGGSIFSKKLIMFFCLADTIFFELRLTIDKRKQKPIESFMITGDSKNSCGGYQRDWDTKFF